MDPSEVAVDIEIRRQHLVDGVMTDIEGNHSEKIVPGDTVIYRTFVESVETGDTWVRMRVNIEFTDRYGRKVELTRQQIETMVKIKVDETQWIKLSGDGWWYFKQPLKGVEKTPALFEQIVFDGASITPAFAGGSFRMSISAHAVQAKNNATTLEDVAGWPLS